MSAKNDKNSFIEQSFTTSKNQNYNLDLNQSKKCTTLIPVQSNSKSNNDKHCDFNGEVILRGTAATYFIVSDKYEGKEKLQSWNKSSKTFTFTTVNEENNDLKKRWKNENILKTINKGTVSLCIAKYEKLNKASSDSLNKSFQKSWLIQKQKQINPASTFVSQSPFKFQRQQNDKVPEPEVSQFKTCKGVEIATRRSATTSNSPNSMITERIPKPCLTKSFSNYEHTSEKTSSSQNSISNYYSTSSEGSESSEEMISVFPIFSLVILFLYKFMQITTNVCKRAIGNKPNPDEQSTKTGDDEKNVHG